MVSKDRTANMSSKSKYLMAFFGTTIVLYAVWNRQHGEENIVKYQLHGDERVMPRHKRQAAGDSLNNIYNNFDEVNGCCKVPSLLPPEVLAMCRPNEKKAKKQKKLVPVQTTTDGGWFGNIRNLYMPQRSVTKTARKGRQAPQKIGMASVCYTDCVFSSLGLMNGSALDLNAIETQFVERNYATGSWKQIIQDALYTCEEPAACATPETIYMNGRFCNIKPTILMNCVRKQLVLNCPGAVKSDNCNSGMSKLRVTNVLSLG